jgi:cytochrome c553
MKRTLVMAAVGIVGACVMAAGAVVAPDVVSYYRFEGELDRRIEASQSGGGPWPPMQETCFFCHGQHGQPAHAGYPALSGQPAAYVEAQLRAFASGQRQSATMGPLARSLSDEQIKFIADYYARQAPGSSGSSATNATLEQRGRALVQDGSCRACHGDGLAGRHLAPRLEGQGETYLADQLIAFKDGRRRDASGAMASVAAALSTDDIPAVAHYLAMMSPAGWSRLQPSR